MRRWWWLVFLCFPVVAWGGGESPDFTPTYQETMVFRNGSHPTANYSGLLLRGLVQVKPTVVYGDSTLAGADASLSIGSTDFTTDERRILVKVDLSALPDSAVVTDAFLCMYLTCHTAAGDSCGGLTAGTKLLQVRRVVMPWTGAATWNTYDGSTSWGTAGCNDSWTTWSAPYGGSSLTSFVGLYPSELVGATWFGTQVAASVDSVFNISGFSGAVDAFVLVDHVFRWGGDSTVDGANVALRVNITREVQHWHDGSWENNGLLLLGDPDVQDLSNFIAFQTQYGPTYLRDPFVVVRYLYATPGSGGRRGGVSIGPTP